MAEERRRQLSVRSGFQRIWPKGCIAPGSSADKATYSRYLLFKDSRSEVDSRQVAQERSIHSPQRHLSLVIARTTTRPGIFRSWPIHFDAGSGPVRYFEETVCQRNRMFRKLAADFPVLTLNSTKYAFLM